MKKSVTKFISFILIIITCLSLTACHDFGAGGTNGGGSSDNGNETNGSEIIAPVNLPDSRSLAESITFNQNVSGVQNVYSSIESVKRSCVALVVETANEQYSGSGVIIDVDDKMSDENVFYIITCHHMMINGGTVTVLIPDKDFRYDNADYVFSGVIGGKKQDVANKKVTLVGGDETSDIAVLKLDISGSKITSKDIVTAKFIKDGRTVSYGETVFAIGNPSGVLPGTLSMGYVSYIDRETFVGDIGVMTLYQIDMTTHPGSSGGALFNEWGDLIGITNSGDEEYVGLNFAIPYSVSTSDGIDNGFVNIAKQLIVTALFNDFENYGYVSGRKQTIGFVVSSSNVSGAEIDTVYENSVAEKKGMKEGDVITGVTVYKESNQNNGETHAVSSVKEFKDVMSQVKIGDTVVFSVSRLSSNGSDYTQTYSVKIEINQFYFANTGVYKNS